MVGYNAMIYNVEKKVVRTKTTCLECKYYNQKLHKCENGMGNVCFEMDKFGNLIDPKTGLKFKK